MTIEPISVLIGFLFAVMIAVWIAAAVYPRARLQPIPKQKHYDFLIKYTSHINCR